MDGLLEQLIYIRLNIGIKDIITGIGDNFTQPKVITLWKNKNFKSCAMYYFIN